MGIRKAGKEWLIYLIMVGQLAMLFIVSSVKDLRLITLVTAAVIFISITGWLFTLLISLSNRELRARIKIADEKAERLEAMLWGKRYQP